MPIPYLRLEDGELAQLNLDQLLEAESRIDAAPREQKKEVRDREEARLRQLIQKGNVDA